MHRPRIVGYLTVMVIAAGLFVPMGVTGVSVTAAPTATDQTYPTDDRVYTTRGRFHTATERSTGTPDRSDPESDDPGIIELYPNPVTTGNRGEYLVVRVPKHGNWTLYDGYHEASIPANASGEIALTMAPEYTSAHVDTDAVDLVTLRDHFPLAATGDRIELRREGITVDAVEYGRVREGHRWKASWGEWRPDGYTPRHPKRTEDVNVTSFVLPDSPAVPMAPIRSADDRLFLAAYTLESERVVETLIDAARRGVTVRVLLEGTPVGGFSGRGADAAKRLDTAGVDVRVLDGDPDRFRFHHAKYAVADDRAVVLTENWKASGTGGRSNRGWGAVVDDEKIADDLASLFENDVNASDTRDWGSFSEETTFYPTGTANGTYPTRFEPQGSRADTVTVLTAPGNAADRIVARIDRADDRAYAIVPRTDGSNGRIVRALRRAAERGVDTKLLLSGTWYDRDDNRDLERSLAEEPINVAVAEPRGRYGKVHAKGVIVDETAIVGSLNYNEVAKTENREVLLAIDDPDVADYYAKTYAADWRGGGVHLPVGLLGGLVAATAVGGLVARREVRFL